MTKDFERGIWFAIDYLIRWADEPSLAAMVARDAGISRTMARQLWKESGLEDTYNASAMKNFLKTADLAAEKHKGGRRKNTEGIK